MSNKLLPEVQGEAIYQLAVLMRSIAVGGSPDPVPSAADFRSLPNVVRRAWIENAEVLTNYLRSKKSFDGELLTYLQRESNLCRCGKPLIDGFCKECGPSSQSAWMVADPGVSAAHLCAYGGTQPLCQIKEQGASVVRRLASFRPDDLNCPLCLAIMSNPLVMLHAMQAAQIKISLKVG